LELDVKEAVWSASGQGL